MGKGNNSAVKLLFATVIVCVMMVVISTLFVTLPQGGRSSHLSRTATYTSRAPISINGNGGFTSANGVTGGSGTASDPYIIADWDINTSTADGISIQNTNEHFIVRNCYIHGSPFYYGILLENCVNGTLEDNDCTNDLDGIILWGSSYSTVNDNNCSSNSFYGIFAGATSYDTLDNNKCSSNGHEGIELGISSNDTLNNNKCSSNGHYGMHLISSNNNTLSNNNCSSNNIYGIALGESSNNTLNNNNCSNNFGGIYLGFSNSNTLSSNNFSSNDEVGIHLFYSNNNTLSNNNCSSNTYYGIDLNSSSDTTMTWNQLRDNSLYGMFIDSESSSNIIAHNTFIGNNGSASTFDPNHVQAHDDGTSNWWNSTNGYGNYWSDWTTPDANHDGIVDHPYNISGSAGAKDYYPLTTVETGRISLMMMAILIGTACVAAVLVALVIMARGKSKAN